MTGDNRTSRPNILLIHCHDLGRHLSCYGARTVDSPHLAELAAAGVSARSMFAAAPSCSPSRAALFTGRYPHSNGVLGLTHAHFAWDLDPAEVHLARRLGRAGYRTELVGVHHESRTRPDSEVAATLGFDRVDTGGHAEQVADRAVAALARHAHSDRPFYLQVGFLEPHRIPGGRDEPGVMGFLGDHVEPDQRLGVDVPAYLVDEDSARREIAELQGAIHHLDAAVGRILAQLDVLGQRQDTITIFTTDHGLALPRAKCSLYDPGLEIAFLIHWPGGGWTGGRSVDDLLVNVDAVPTLLDVLGLATEEDPPLQGRSFQAQLDGAPADPTRTHIFGEMTYHDYYDPRRSVRTDRWKLIANFSSAPGFMDPSQSWRRRCRTIGDPAPGSHPGLELYDLRADPLERDNLADQPAHAAVQRELVGQLAEWMDRTDDPLRHGAIAGPIHHAVLERLPSIAR